MKKKLIVILAAAVVILGSAAAFFFASYTRVGGQFLKKGQRVYDLRDKNLTTDDYEAIRAAMPDATIYWRVRFQNASVPEDATELVVHSLTAEDVADLSYLPDLRVLRAEDCTDYDALLLAQKTYPDLVVFYNVAIGSDTVAGADEAAVLTDADAEAMQKLLPYLPKLKEVTLEGKLPASEALINLRRSFPEISFRFSLTLDGKQYASDAGELDFSDAIPDELEEVLPLFGSCRVILPASTTHAVGTALADRFPEHFFIFPYTVAGKSFLTDAAEIDLSGTAVTTAEAEALLPYFKALQKVVMINCGILSEDMDALNRRHEDVKFVWTVKIAGVDYRTDMRYFYPWQQHISRMINLDCSNLRYCTDIEVVDVGHYWVTDCSFLEYTPHVKYLILAMTGCRDITPVKYLQELEYLEIFEMIVDDYSPLLECKALKDLNVGLTYADPTPLTRMTWLENLYWYGGGDYLRGIGFDFDWEAGLPNTYVELNLTRNGDKEWRYLPRYYLMRDILNTGYLNQDAARTVWGDDIDAIMACKLNPDMVAEEVIGEILARRRANGEYIPGVKNSGPMSDALRHFLKR